MSLGFIIRFLKNNFELDIDLVTVDYNYEGLSIIIKNQSDFIRKKFEKFKHLIGIQTKDVLEARLKKLEDFFLELKNKQDLRIAEEIAKEPLSQKCIEDFKSKVLKNWREKKFSSAIFKYFNNIDYVTEDNNLKKIFTMHPYMKGTKRFFIEKHYVYTDDLGIGSGINKRIDDEFYSEIRRIIEGKKIEQYSLLSSAIDSLTDKLIKNNFNPNLIIINPQLIHKDKNFLNNFTPYHKIPKDQIIKIGFRLLGKYENLFIISSFNYFDKNIVIVCDLNKTIKMVRQKNSDWYDRTLKMNISEVDEEISEDIYKKNPEYWLKRDGFKRSYKEALLEIQTGVMIDISEYLYFKILNSNAIEIAKLNVES